MKQPFDAKTDIGDAHVPGSLHLSTDALRNRKPELCPGLTVCICRQVHFICRQMHSEMQT
ncbi:hypothetical protein Taro_009853 [Colocasia esculenta]|uniref:Uncharacterized protein n=1 Tax=Colocasia esculenta TaxID=4460 RepID=A0A843U229_COLES|nr:hypothetical protein [Colocasia esculenta]